MPQPDVRAYLQSAFRGRPGEPGIFSTRELGRLQRLLDDPALPADAVRVLVWEFQTALAAGRLLTEPVQRRTIARLFDRLQADGRLPPDLEAPPDGLDWVDALIIQAPDLPPAPPADAPPTAHVIPTALGPVGVTGTRLTLGGTAHDLTGDPPRGAVLELLLALLAADLEALPQATRGALAGALGEALVRGHLAIPSTGDGRLRQGGVTLCALLVLGRCRALSPEVAASLRALAETDPRPALRAAAADALAAGGLSAPPDDDDTPALRAAAVALLVSEPRWVQVPFAFTLDRDQVAILLCGLAFCGAATAIGALFEQLVTFATVRLDPGTVRLDAAETQALLDGLSAYVDDTDTPSLQYGKWAAVAARHASALTHADAVQAWLGVGGTLLADPPSLDGIHLSADAAAWARVALAAVRDADGAAAFSEALHVAHDLVPGDGLLAGTALAALERAWVPIASRAEASPDGRAELVDLPDALRAGTAPLRDALHTAWAHLHAVPPAVVLEDGARLTLPTSLVAPLAEVLRHRLASDRSWPNLVLALATHATDGALDVAAGTRFLTFLDRYLATWPHLRTFDFNKLERLAAAEVSGARGPLCTLLGQPVDPGQFHVAVGASVRDALAHVAFPWPWIAHRFGYRAKQAIELVDLLAERAHQGRGPLASLQLTFPGVPVQVIATTSDMAYNSLVFRVLSDTGPRIFYMDSQGALHPHPRHPEARHVLFEATVDPAGHIAVEHPDRLPLSPQAWPLMNPYGVGDRIDVEQEDTDASVHLVAAERFETRYTVRLATITGYDTRGNHQLLVHLPAGDVARTVTTEQIRSWNNPHVVSELGGEACTVRFDLRKDTRWVEDLTELDHIAAAHGLPFFDLALSETALAEVQKRFLKALNAYTSRTLRYPRTPPVDDGDRTFADRLATGTWPMGDYLEAARGVCRHQFIREHMGKQRAGLEERFASGAANTYTGDFRGLHIWGEVSLADRSRLAFDNPEPHDARFLSDPTWTDPYIPLWDGAYGSDLRRVEMYDRTRNYATLLARGDAPAP